MEQARSLLAAAYAEFADFLGSEERLLLTLEEVLHEANKHRVEERLCAAVCDLGRH